MKGERLAMSKKERDRKVILCGVKEGKLTLVEASKKLSVSYRQIKRIYKRYSTEGDAGLIHGNCGAKSHNAYDESDKKEVLNLYRERYEGFGPVLACEKLLKEGYQLSDETLRLWLIAEGLWERKRKRKGYRQRRLRRACFGELLQLDGSHHRWFGEGTSAHCLMNLVDDATGTTLSLLSEQETTEAAFQLLQKWVERYGIPSEIYVDLKTVYVSAKTKRGAEEIHEVNGAFTHFSRACEKLGIRIIKAYSPQAKGRVERNHAVYQDRFVKELKLEGITSLDEANALLESGFIEELNRRFSKAPQSEIDAHREVKSYGDLSQIFCWEYTRVVQQDWTVRFLTRHYQIKETRPLKVRPRQVVTVRQHLDGTVTLWHKEESLPSEQIDTPRMVKALKEKKGYDAIQISRNARKNKDKTPWGLYNPGWLNGKVKVREGAVLKS